MPACNKKSIKVFKDNKLFLEAPSMSYASQVLNIGVSTIARHAHAGKVHEQGYFFVLDCDDASGNAVSKHLLIKKLLTYCEITKKDTESQWREYLRTLQDKVLLNAFKLLQDEKKPQYKLLTRSFIQGVENAYNEKYGDKNVYKTRKPHKRARKNKKTFK